MIPPTEDDVDRYCRRMGYRFVSPHAFIVFHIERQWKIRGRPMRSWKKAVTTWEMRQRAEQPVELTIGKGSKEDEIPPLLAEILRQTHISRKKGWPYDN